MALAPGTRLGPYEIIAPLGAGGMGEVYRGRDTRLERDVAIKVLPASVAGDPQQLARFEREARAVAALSHPNILAIFDVGVQPPAATTASPIAYAVTELLDGETLRARLGDAGALPPRKAIEIAVHLARGLAAAHDRTIVHRDLKPENIFLLRDGQVKILDFGLAKAAGEGTAPETDDTHTAFATSPGTILGTVGYMAPEQVRGQAVDGRTDIFALGAVTYEMLSGRRAFQGATSADTMTAILKEDPPEVIGSRSDVSPALDRIVRHCLEKNPAERFQSARDVAFAVEALTGTREVEMERRGATASRGSWRNTVIAAGLVIAAASAGWWFGAANRPSTEAPWSQFTQLTDAAGVETAPVIAPDGNSFAFVQHVGRGLDIFVQRIGGRNPIAVAADPERNENWPAYSSDGEHIAFNESDTDGGIFVAGATGESVRRLTDAGFNPTWSPDGARIAFVTEETLSPYSRTNVSALWTVPVVGGAPVRLTAHDAMQPAWSPSGERIAFWFIEAGQRDLATVSVATGEVVALQKDAPLDWSPTWAPDGRHLFFSSDRGGSMGLWRQRIDERSGQAIGAPEPVAGGVEARLSLPSLSADGRRLAFRSETSNENPARLPFDPATERVGEPVELLRQSGRLTPVSVSPDGSWLSLTNEGDVQEDVFLMRTDGTGLRRVTDDAARDRFPRFSPDGQQLIFYSNRSGQFAAYAIRTDGSGLIRLSDVPDLTIAQPSLSPDAKRLLAMAAFQGKTWMILAEPPWPFTRSSATLRPAPSAGNGRVIRPIVWSPDGQRIAGVVNNGEDFQATGVGVYDVATGQARALTQDRNVWSPAFLPDSRRLIYFSADGALVVLDVTTGVRRLIPVPARLPTARPSLAISRDGRTIYYGAEQRESNIWMLERR